jgi:Rps23 Pro-64 3,4-dihydroxylase Tpa1-like proline 4-hydroxylase
MNLSLHIPNKIWHISNFLDYDSYKDIHNFVMRNRSKLNIHDSKKFWSKVLYKNIETPLRCFIDIDSKKFQKFKFLLNYNSYCNLDTSDTKGFVIHYMKKGSGINWHDDGNWKYGVTYYINNRWNDSWGGELMFRDEKINGFIKPIKNSLVIIKSPIQHKVVPVLNNTIPRTTIQMFLK